MPRGLFSNHTYFEWLFDCVTESPCIEFIRKFGVSENYLPKPLDHRADEMENIDFLLTLALPLISMKSLSYLTLRSDIYVRYKYLTKI